MLKSKKLMLRDMHTDVIGDTECINHNYQSKSVWDISRGLHDEDICIRCDSVKPLDPIDNNTVEVD